MDSKNTYSGIIGIIGAGSFGTAVANIIAENENRVLLHVRDPQKAEKMQNERISSNQKLNENILICNNLREIGERCEIIFPMVPSANFREMIKELSPYLKPYHVLIHGTKGFDLYIPENEQISAHNPLTREHVKTMSEVIRDETSVLRVGCLAGPNLARELDERKPAATVVASHFDEVIHTGQSLLKNERFMIYGSKDLTGIELCGILKNTIAIGAGSIHGLDLGENAKAMFISRGLIEMIYIGQVLGGNMQAFLGLAGIGDLIATCNSSLSRNFNVGYRLAKGETLEEILRSMDEVAEGVKTIKIVKELAVSYKVKSPITMTLFKVMHGEMTIEKAHNYLMSFPFEEEMNLLDKTKEET